MGKIATNNNLLHQLDVEEILNKLWVIGPDNREADMLEVNASRWLGKSLLDLALVAITIFKFLLKVLR